MMKRTILLLLAAFWLIGRPAVAQDAPSITAADLKKSPQRYWASYFVFSDRLESGPSGRTMRIDDREVTRFKTATIGELYAETDALEALSAMEEGEECLLYATVIQKKKSFWGGGDDFAVIVRSAAAMASAEAASAPVAASERQAAIIALLEAVKKEVRQEMFGVAQAEGVSLDVVLSSDEYRDRVRSSIRSAVRKIEEQERSSGYEFMINIIWAVMRQMPETPETAAAPEYAPGQAYEPGDMVALEREAAARAMSEARVKELSGVVDEQADKLSEALEEIARLNEAQQASATAGEQVKNLTGELAAARAEAGRESAARIAAETKLAELEAAAEAQRAERLQLILGAPLKRQ